MKLQLLARSVAVLCSSLFFADASFAQRLPQPDNVPVSLHGQALAGAADKLIGRGVVLDDARQESRAATVASACGAADAEIVWREVRRRTDPEGGTHVFYRQFVVGEGIDAELAGSEIGVHRTPDGRLLNVGGRQFDSVILSGCAKLSAAQAADLANERVLLHKGQYAAHAAGRKFSMETIRAERLAKTKLKLVQIDGVFRPAYYAIGEDAEGEPHAVVLDAETERLLAIDGANPHANCVPTEPLSFVNATGQPVRPELVNWRGLKANVAGRAGGFTHEGVWMPSLPMSGEPLIRHIVYHGTTDVNFQCGALRYTVFPLKVDPAVNCCTPVYVDNGSWKGRAAGDALWNTYRTISTFRAMGRKGWDDLNGEARIVVMSTSLGDQAQWISAADQRAPLNSVMIRSPQRMYNLAASLDLIAHEFGHGVIEMGADFDNTDQGRQFDEGWADVIGMAVEKKAQPTGNGLEQSSDWLMHEDAAVSGYARGAVDDGTAGHQWVGTTYVYDSVKQQMTNSYTFNDRLHASDGAAETGNPHLTGNMLNVAYRIMAAGGLNPVCARMPNAIGCEAGNAVTGSLGASKAGSLLFHAIQFNVTHSTTWSDVADRVVEAAFQKYNLCSAGTIYNAAAEQDAVRKAFRGIGYPSSYNCTLTCTGTCE